SAPVAPGPAGSGATRDESVGRTGVASPPAGGHAPSTGASLASDGIVVTPVGEIELPTAQLNIPSDRPRKWRDMSVPGPLSLIGVTVVTGAPEGVVDFGRRGNLALRGRVYHSRGHQLNSHQECHHREEQPEPEVSTHRR